MMQLVNIWLLKYQKPICWFLFFVSSFFILFGKYHHEMWLDEWQAVGIARSATSFIDLYKLRNYEGHPYFYFLLLYVLQLVSHNSKAIILMHACFAIGSMYLLLVKSNISVILKCLFIFSIYFIWEFTVMNRVYVICLFFIFLYTYLLQQQKLSFLISILLLTILCQLDAYSAAVALLIAGFYFFTIPLSANQKIIFAMAVILNFLVLYVSICQPVDGSSVYRNPFSFRSFQILHFIRFFDFGFFTHHSFKYNQWNCLYLFPTWVTFLLFVVIVFGIFDSIRYSILRFCLLVSLIGLSYINLQISALALRHIGFYFIVFICAFWLQDHKQVSKRVYLFLIPILAIQAFWGIRMFLLDVNSPFTLAPKMVAHIKEFHYKDTVFVGYGEMSISSPSANLGLPIINLKTKIPWRFYQWSIPESIPTKYNDTNVLQNFNSILAEKGPYILIVNENRYTHWIINILDSIDKMQNKNLKKMPEFSGAIVPSENFYLYKVDSTIIWK